MKQPQHPNLSAQVSQDRSRSRSSCTVFPPSFPRRVFGQYAPSNRINVGAIGVGRISRGHDMPAILKVDTARIVAVCDSPPTASRKASSSSTTSTQRRTASPTTASPAMPITTSCSPTRTSTPSSSPRRTTSTRVVGADAVRAGKDVYLQKPASLTIAEGRTSRDAVQATGRILQIGSQQRSWKQFHRACELVRNGRIGEVQHVEIGLPGDPSGRRPHADARPHGLQLRCVARLNAGRLLHRRSRHPTKAIRPSRLAALRAVRRRHDHRLGRAPRRYRALGHEHRVHRSRRDLGHRRISRRTACGTCMASSRRTPATPTASPWTSPATSRTASSATAPRAGSSSRATR